ncbi:glycosyltransferase family 4 protein [Paenibacillus sp. y28]|uniref:glycosyltransferase family 4 protein n=1 Tax=Paenibacillus sp. y28 TaxID=3129110 RepID=UPI00301878B9
MKEKKLRVVIVAHDVGGQGGMERHLEEVIMRMKGEHEVTVVACSMKLSDCSGVRFIRIPVIAKPDFLKIWLFALLATIRLFFVKRDILHTTGAIVLNRADFSTVHFCHAGYLKETGDTRQAARRSLPRRISSWLAARLSLSLERWIYHPKRTQRLIAVSGRVRRELLAAFPYAEEHIAVIPNGVDLGRFRPADQHEKRRWRAAFGLAEEGPLLLFMGGDWPRKGLDHVIGAFQTLSAEHPELRLAVVGSGDSEAYTSVLPEEIARRITFAGKQPEPELWFGMSDIFVFPSSYETFSLVVHEAAACGLLIVTTPVGGVEDLIDDRVEGFYIERDAVHVASTLRTLLHDLEHYRSCGDNARTRVAGLTWDHTYTCLVQAYRQRFTDSYGSRGFELERHHA